jgi:hypothetical protein
MVTVDKYIRKLIFEHDCVIIPEFGGLLTHHIGAQYDSANGVMVPSRKRLAFNEVLNVDDGLLVYFISVNEKMNRDEAAQGVRKYVETLRSKMQAGESILINSIGSFAANAEGKIVFEPEHNQNFNNDWYGFKSFRLKQQSDSRFMPVEESAIAIAETYTHGSVASADESDEVNEPAPIMQWYKWLAAAMLAGVVFTASMTYKTTDSTSMLSTLNPFTGIRDVLVNTTFFNSFESKEAKVIVFNEVEVPVQPQPGETLTTELSFAELEKPFQGIVSEPIKEIVPKAILKVIEQPKEVLAPVENKKAKLLIQSSKYYLIAGSFGRKKNALDLQQKLVKRGFSSAMIIEEVDSKLIKVSAGTYTNMVQAIGDKYRIDSMTQADSWVYYKK